MPDVLDETDVLRAAAARSLLTLVRDHKASCSDEDCTVTLASLYPVYLALLHRAPTDAEREAFL